MQLVKTVLRTFQGQSPIVGALFLVAWENVLVYFPSFRKAAEEEKLFPATLEGMSSFFAEGYSKHRSDSAADEVARRRFFYFYMATLLKVAQQRAKQKPDLWESIVDVWVALLPGARALRSTLDKTSLWGPEHIVFFDSIKTEDEGESYCLSMLMPSNLRYHKSVTAWLERDLSPEERKLIDDACNIFGSNESSNTEGVTPNTAFLAPGKNSLEIDDGEGKLDASDLPPQLPFHVSVSDRLASDTDVWDPSGDYATLEEAVAAAKKIVDDQLEANFRKNPEDRPLMLLDWLLDFGFIPYVTGPGGKSLFNSRGYAEKKCYELKGAELPSKLLWGGSNV